jgi:tRNA modification GTPase
LSAKAETICAVATPPGRGGVGVIRVSGARSNELVRRLCGSLPPPRQAALRTLRDRAGETIDQAIILRFAAPKSFTGEDVVEIQTHGSPVVLELILRELVAGGARRARPGEFSERAFLNDRIDLAQAEAIADLIDATSAQAARAASRSLEGAFSNEVDALAGRVTDLRVWVEAALDFADEDVDFLADGQVRDRTGQLLSELDRLIARTRSGRLLIDGLRVAIVGKPNAGKSSLLNALTQSDSAIVTEQPGTTRDVLRERVAIAGIPVVLADTAGLRETHDSIEREGVRRAQLEMRQADLLLWVVEAGEPAPRPPAGPDFDRAVIRINNKIDLSGDRARIDEHGVWLSLKTGEGMEQLETAVREALDLNSDAGGEFSARQRHIEALDHARTHLATGLAEISATGSGELLAECLKDSAASLGEITGRLSSDELLGRIFSSFCIGK